MSEPDWSPLTGFRVAVTSSRRAEELGALLRRRGATVTCAAAIDMVPLPDDDELRQRTQALIDTPPDIVIATTGIARGRSQGEIDRYTVWPGQACSYKIGHTVWTRLRDEAKRKAGTKWDPKDFHRVLTLGAMPLTVLEQVVRERMASS